MKKHVYIVGLGPGSWELAAQEAKQCMRQAQLLIGSRRLLDAIPVNETDAVRIESAAGSEIARLIGESAYTHIAAVFSGDIGFHSGAEQLRKCLDAAAAEIHTVCGISSVQYFAAALNRSWQNWRLVSAHGTLCNIIGEILAEPFVQGKKEIFFLTGGAVTVHSIAELLCKSLQKPDGSFYDYDIRMAVGISLSEKRHTVIEKPLYKIEQYIQSLDILSVCPAVVLITWYQTDNIACNTGLLSDADFIRGTVPMTKKETRLLIASLLTGPGSACSVIYDIGAGTGSICIQLAKLLPFASVYAIEADQEACRLIEQNRERHGALNVHIAAGYAPDAFASLPVPDAAFIGGSDGRLAAIFDRLCDMNPLVRIVLSAITAETYAEAVRCCAERRGAAYDITQIAVNKTKTAGNSHTYHMFSPVTPVFVFDSYPDGNV